MFQIEYCPKETAMRHLEILAIVLLASPFLAAAQTDGANEPTFSYRSATMAASDFTGTGTTDTPPDTNWTVQQSGTTVTLYAIKAVSLNVAWAAGAGGVVVRTTNSGTTWTVAGALGTDIYTITAVDASVAIVGTSPSFGAAKLWRTTNGGTTWVARDSTGIFWDYVHMFDAHNGFALGDPPASSQNWVLRKTTDGGGTWFSAGNLSGGGRPEGGWNNSMMWLNELTGWFGSNESRMYRTTDGGTSWTFAPTGCTSSVHFNSLNVGLAAAAGGTLNRSTDGGATWIAGPASLPAGSASLWGHAGTQEFWAAAGNNVYFSADFGATWTTSGHGYSGTSALYHFNAATVGLSDFGWACGSGGTIVRYAVPVVAVREQVRNIPSSIPMIRNYPNPFNPSTTIVYHVAHRSRVQLSIFDLLGREIARLVDSDQGAGEHSAIFGGSGYPSGVYFCRLNTGSVIQVRKIILAK
jgi:photosystem II stability/assembly factor-like uncharacterized protein